MTIVVTGGGSGGHITPILAVAKELKRQHPGITIIYIGQKGDGLLDVVANDPSIDEIRTVYAGKFRRYHGEGWKQLFAIPTQAKNLRDGFLVLLGSWQSFWLLRKIKPAVIFTRGGFVSVPVALAAALQHIPYMTHDSDSTPSLANRLIARWAYLHAVAMPEELYSYPRAKTTVVGIPIEADYQPLTPALFAEYRKQLTLPPDAPVLLVTGGGNGAMALNEIVVANAAYLMKRYPSLHIMHFAGRGLEPKTTQAYSQVLAAADMQRLRVLGFSTDFYRYSGVAEVIIARGGATNLAEFAMQRKACVIIPAKQLIWAIKNTEALAERQAVVYLTEDQAEQERRLATTVAELLDDETKRRQLATNLGQLARPDAAKQLAMLLLEQANKKLA